MTLPTGPHQSLPVPRDVFVNRDAEQRTIGDLLADPQVPLVTLTGPGGVGKSRLAVQAADRLQLRYADGAAFVPCAAIADPAHLPAVIAGALNIPEAGEGPLYERLIDHLRCRQILIVLDNLEHLPGAAEVLGDLLVACPGVQALATSRSPLRVSGERELPLAPLPVPGPDGARSVAEIGANESVAMFVARARAVNPNFTLTDQNAVAVAEVCRRLDGLPLAIELAAARARALSSWEMLEQLDRSGRLALLEGGPGDRPERLRSLRSAIAWSYDLLPPPAQILFRRLAVFAGGWDLDGATAVCDGTAGRRDGGTERDGLTGRRGDGETRTSDGAGSPFAGEPAASPSRRPAVLDAMSALLDYGLVQRIERPCREARFAMLETIREFALERLEAAGEQIAVERHHDARCLAFAEEAAAGLDGPDQALWLQRLEAERPNLRSALTRLAAAGEPRSSRIGLQLATALGPFWRLNGHFDDAVWLHRFLEQTRIEPATPALARTRAAALRWAGEIAAQQGDAKTAVALLKDALERSRALGDRAGATAAAGAMGVALVMRGAPETIAQSIPFLEEAISLHRSLGDERRAAFLQVYLGYAVGHRRDPAEGARMTEAAVEAVRSDGDARRAEVAVGLLLRGWLALVACDRGHARELLGEALAMSNDQGAVHGQAAAHAGLGWEALARGEREEAARHLRAGLVIAGRAGYRLGIAINLQGIVRIVSRGRHDPRRVARLSGAVDSLGGVGRLLLNGSLLDAYEQDLGSVRAALGREAFEAERACGLRLRSELAVIEGLTLAAPIEANRTEGPVSRRDLPRLTAKETEVLRLLENRLTNQEIADALRLSVRTVETHVQHLCEKLAVKGRRAAVDFARELGLV